MLAAITQLLLFQLAGEIVARGLDLPVPGPVLGMAFLFLALVWRGEVGDELKGTCQGLLQHLSLLFVPAGTGIVVYAHRLAQEWLPILISLLVSTAAALAVTGGVIAFLSARKADSPTEGKSS